MDLSRALRIGWRSITGHKLRSALTTLGVIIGVGSVIAFVVMGGGFQADVLEDVEATSEPTMMVQTQTSASTGFGWRLLDSPVYTDSDVAALESIDGVAYVAPTGPLSAVQLAHGNETVLGGFDVEATVAERFEHANLTGEPFEDGGEAVVNRRLATAIEGNVSVGDRIEVSFEDGHSETVTVTGVVTEEFGTPSPAVYLPLDPHYETRIETPDGATERAYPFLDVRAESLGDVERVQESARDYLRNESDAAALLEGGKRIRVLTREDAVERFTDVIDQVTIFVVAIAAISLVVGSIGIANIMIVSVTERTRQIGIMKAVGARKRDVIQLFLTESVVLGAIGAALGVALGIGLGYLAVSVFGWPMVYPVEWIAIAVVVGVAVGVSSGLYPAWRAAGVDPIEALRRE